jgi:hypothetical protein
MAHQSVVVDVEVVVELLVRLELVVALEDLALEAVP